MSRLKAGLPRTNNNEGGRIGSRGEVDGGIEGGRLSDFAHKGYNAVPSGERFHRLAESLVPRWRSVKSYRWTGTLDEDDDDDIGIMDSHVRHTHTPTHLRTYTARNISCMQNINGRRATDRRMEIAF